MTLMSLSKTLNYNCFIKLGSAFYSTSQLLMDDTQAYIRMVTSAPGKSPDGIHQVRTGLWQLPIVSSVFKDRGHKVTSQNTVSSVPSIYVVSHKVWILVFAITNVVRVFWRKICLFLVADDLNLESNLIASSSDIESLQRWNDRQIWSRELEVPTQLCLPPPSS